MITSQKQAWFQKVSDLANAWQLLNQATVSASTFFWNNEMGSGQTNELVDADMSGTIWDGVTAAQMIAAGVTAQEAFATLYDTYDAILAKVKTAP